MPRTPRISIGDIPYHVLNRANNRRKIFYTNNDYSDFETLLREAKQLIGMRILSYCIMPNHWHLVLQPYKDGDLSEFMRWLTTTHASHFHHQHDTVGTGHLYQGRFKSFPIEKDSHLLAVCRYVEANPLRAKLVKRAEQWEWSSLWRRKFGTTLQKKLLSGWPIEFPDNYLQLVNEKEMDEEIEVIRQSATKEQPYGTSKWSEKFGKQKQKKI